MEDGVMMTINDFESATPPDVTCPFCGETGFDKPGLKTHLLVPTLFGGNPRCPAFEETETL